MLVLILLGLIPGIFGNDVTSSVVQLQFKLREDRVPGIVNYIFNNSLQEDNVTTEDIILLYHLDGLTLEETEAVFNYFNRSHVVDNLQLVLTTLNLTYKDFHNGLVQNLGINGQDADRAIGALGVDQLEFLSANLYNKEDKIYDLLRQGVFDEEHIANALSTVGKTRDEVYAGGKAVILTKLRALTSTQIFDTLKTKGWDKIFFNDLWKAFNLTTRDVYNVPKFRDILVNITEELNRNQAIGVIVNFNKLVVLLDVFKNFTQKADCTSVRLEVDNIEVESTPVGLIGPSIVELDLKQTSENFLLIYENYTTTPESCTYISIVDSKVVTEDVELLSKTHFQKNNSTVYLRGSPIVCDNHLYGLVDAVDDDYVELEVFYSRDNLPEVVFDASALNLPSFSLIIILIYLSLL